MSISEADDATTRLGTVSHMPRELLTEGHGSKFTDVYSFGVLLWEGFFLGASSFADMLRSNL